MEGGSPSGKRGGANTLETRPRKIFGEHASRDPEIVAHKALNNDLSSTSSGTYQRKELYEFSKNQSSGTQARA